MSFILYNSEVHYESVSMDMLSAVLLIVKLSGASGVYHIPALIVLYACWQVSKLILQVSVLTEVRLCTNEYTTKYYMQVVCV